MTLLIQRPVNRVTSKKAGVKNRIWLEGKEILNYFKVGETIKIEDQDDGETIVAVSVPVEAKRSDRSLRSVSSKVNRYSGAKVGLIELNESNSEILKTYKPEQVLKIVMQRGVLKITVKHDVLEERIQERESTMIDRLKKGIPLEKADLFAGGGTQTIMSHDGFKLAGLSSVVRFALDNYDQAIENLATNVRHVFDDYSVLINSDISLIDPMMLPKVDILTITAPCTDTAKCARAKKGNKLETDQTAHLVFYYSKILEHCNPSIVFIENVKTWKNFASWHVLAALLTQFGYKFQVREIDSHKEGFSLETRERMYVVAQSRNLDLDFDLDDVESVSKPRQTLAEVLDYVSPESEVWKPYDHLKKEQKKHEAKGNGFKMQIFTPESTYIGTLRALYQRAGTSDPLIKHPTKDLYRQVSEIEHCRIKEIPEEFVSGTVVGHAQKILGNGLSGLVSKSIFYYLGLSLKRLVQPKIELKAKVNDAFDKAGKVANQLTLNFDNLLSGVSAA